MRARHYNGILLESQSCPRLLGMVLKRLWQCCKLFFSCFLRVGVQIRDGEKQMVGGRYLFFFIRMLALFSGSHLGPFGGRGLTVWPHLKQSPCKRFNLLMGFQGEHLQNMATDDNHRMEIKTPVLCLLTPEHIIRGNIELSADVKELFTGDLIMKYRELET